MKKVLKLSLLLISCTLFFISYNLKIVNDYDYIFHIVAFTIITFASSNRIALLLAILLELVQLAIPYRSFELADLIHNLCGVGIAQIIKHGKHE